MRGAGTAHNTIDYKRSIRVAVSAATCNMQHQQHDDVVDDVKTQHDGTFRAQGIHVTSGIQ